MLTYYTWRMFVAIEIRIGKIREKLFYLTTAEVTKRCIPDNKNSKEEFRKVFSVWTKSQISDFEVGWQTFHLSRKCLAVAFR